MKLSEPKNKILIIEDEKPLARVLALKLTYAGFQTKVATSGQEGIDLFKKETFSFILLDLLMTPIDGFKVMETLREMKVSTPVIVLTNLNQAEDEKRARQLGAVGYFIKSNTSILEIVKWVKDKLKITI